MILTNTLLLIYEYRKSIFFLQNIISLAFEWYHFSQSANQKEFIGREFGKPLERENL